MKYMHGILGLLVLLAVTAAPLVAQSTSRSTTEPSDAVAAAAPADAPAPQPVAASGPASQPSSQPASSQPSEPEGMSVAFNNMEVPKVADWLADQFKLPVLISDAAKDKKLTVVCKVKLPADQVLALIRREMMDKGLMLERLDTYIRIRPVEEVMQAHLPELGPDESVADLADPMAIVSKTFVIVHCGVDRVVAVIEPMKSPWARVVVDPNTRRMVVTDTVANLLRFERVIATLDTPLADQTRTEIIRLEHGDASEIISIVRWLIAGRMGIQVEDITTAGGPSRGGARPGAMPGGPSGRPGGPSPAGGGVTRVEAASSPVTLAPHVSRNWIIAVAPAPIMEQILQWVQQLDKPRDEEQSYELVDVQYADVREVATQLGQTIRQMPDPELSQATQVVPFVESRKIIIFGSTAGRAVVRELLAQLDVEDASRRNRRTFDLKYADATEMATRIESLFSGLDLMYSGYGYSQYRRDPGAAKVTVVADARRNAVTVVTDPDTMEEIAKLIEEEDQAVRLEEAMPKIYTLQYVDPGEVCELLQTMFGAKADRQMSFWDLYYGSSSDSTAKAVGRLQGQFTFQVLASSNQLVVSAKNPAHFTVVDEIIGRVDQPQQVGLPVIVELNHANAEDLCEQLNALLAEPGTLANIRRADRSLTEYEGSSEATRSDAGNQQPRNANQPARPAPGEMVFWWQSFRQPEGEVPTSNLVGRIRIVPVYRRNAIMILAPEGYKQPILDLIAGLDEPGRQVTIRAQIGEIQHDSETTLGVRLASDPSLLTDGDTALGLSGVAAYEGIFGETLTIDGRASFFALLNLLLRNFDMKVLQQPSVTTCDNESAQFFVGQDVPTLEERRLSEEGVSTTVSIEYREVGTLLSVRPHITKQGNVDLMINLTISRILDGAGLFGNPVIDRREVTTHVVVADGQTVMLSGIIRQEDFDDVRRWPLLGDLPLLGKLFRSVDKGRRNRELVVFITPHVLACEADVEAQANSGLNTLRQIQDTFVEDAGSPVTANAPAVVVEESP
ncbi:MAG: hypothetical protein GX591_06495 [Planctomycetes bacterium]|nr:hypothetical protein [Planctomycetota bacterium]